MMETDMDILDDMREEIASLRIQRDRLAFALERSVSMVAPLAAMVAASFPPSTGGEDLRCGYRFRDTALESAAVSPAAREVLSFHGDACMRLCVGLACQKAIRDGGVAVSMTARCLSDANLSIVSENAGVRGGKGLRALFCAVFADGGLPAAMDVTDLLFGPVLAREIAQTGWTHPKNRLQHLFHRRFPGQGEPRYVLSGNDDGTMSCQVDIPGFDVFTGKGRTPTGNKEGTMPETDKRGTCRLDGAGQGDLS